MRADEADEQLLFVLNTGIPVSPSSITYYIHTYECMSNETIEYKILEYTYIQQYT